MHPFLRHGLLLAAWLAIPASSFAADDEPRALVEKAIAALGGRERLASARQCIRRSRAPSTDCPEARPGSDCAANCGFSPARSASTSP